MPFVFQHHPHGGPHEGGRAGGAHQLVYGAEAGGQGEGLQPHPLQDLVQEGGPAAGLDQFFAVSSMLSE